MPDAHEPPPVEPWLRGMVLHADPVAAPVLFALQQVREDLRAFTKDLSDPQIWQAPPGLPPLGFHLRHIAGSLDRLVTYLQDGALSEAQMEAMKKEANPELNRDQLLSAVESSLGRTETIIRAIDPSTYAEPRYVGRRRLPTTVIGLIVHIAEHTQRHCGQAITTAKLVRSLA